MFKFKIFEIPDGKSERTIQLNAESIDVGEILIKSGIIQIEFNKTLHFIYTKLNFNVIVELVCDRSLDTFDQEVKQSYEVLFKDEEIEDSADENGAIRKIELESRQIDITQDVIDTILVSLPAKKLHPRFLDEDGNPKDFQQVQFGTPDDDSDSETIDPRWEALKELKK